VADELGPATTPNESTGDSLQWVRVAARAAASKTDEDIVVLDVGQVLSIVGYFVVAAGRNPRQVRTLAEEVEKQVAEAGGPKPLRVEGLDALEWVLLDYGDFAVHVFHVDTRKFYDLERLWRDVPQVAWRDDARVADHAGMAAATGE
jgi:ribosome-associated protein